MYSLFIVVPIFVGEVVWSLFCFAVLCVLSSFAIISLGKRELVALILLSSWCHVAVFVRCLFLAVAWLVPVQFVIVSFFGHTALGARSKYKIFRNCATKYAMDCIR